MTTENLPVQDTVKPVDPVTVADPQTVPPPADPIVTEPVAAAEAAPQTDEQKVQAASEAAKVLQKHKQTASERVQQAVYRQREAEKRAERAEREAAELRASIKPPDPSSYDDSAKYNADVMAHQLDQRDVSRSEKAAKEAHFERIDAIKEAWVSRVEDFKQQAPDFDEVVYSDKVQMSRETGVLVGEMEDGPQVAYFLAKNAGEARRIDRLPERAKAIELGKLAGKLSAPVPRKVTSAPQPITPVSGNKAPKSTAIASMTFADYAKFVADEEKARKR